MMRVLTSLVNCFKETLWGSGEEKEDEWELAKKKKGKMNESIIIVCLEEVMPTWNTRNTGYWLLYVFKARVEIQVNSNQTPLVIQNHGKNRSKQYRWL